MKFRIETKGNARFLRIPSAWSEFDSDQIQELIIKAGGPANLESVNAIGYIAHFCDHFQKRRPFRNLAHRRSRTI